MPKKETIQLTPSFVLPGELIKYLYEKEDKFSAKVLSTTSKKAVLGLKDGFMYEVVYNNSFNPGDVVEFDKGGNSLSVTTTKQEKTTPVKQGCSKRIQPTARF